MKRVVSKPTRIGKSKPGLLHVARRESATSRVAVPDSGNRDFGRKLADSSLQSGAGLVKTLLPEVNRPAESAPVWLSVLLAVSCSARRNGEQHLVRWFCEAGRATYTNQI